MAGNTGKLTRAAQAARGPRMCLVVIRDDQRMVGIVVGRNKNDMLSEDARERFPKLVCFVCAESYTLSYLLRIGRAMVKQESLYE
jgi:hypothetical protein